MNTLSIEDRLECRDMVWDALRQVYFAAVYLDSNYFHTVQVTDEALRSRFPHFSIERMAQHSVAVEIVAVQQVMKQWEVKCDPTLIMEVKSRKTITSYCGQLKVTESPVLMVTCSPTS